MTRAATVALVASLALAIGTPAAADERLVVAIGNDVGLEGEEPLRYAHRDARRFAELMREVGGVQPGRALLVEDLPDDRLDLRLVYPLKGVVDAGIDDLGVGRVSHGATSCSSSPYQSLALRTAPNSLPM